MEQLTLWSEEALASLSQSLASAKDSEEQADSCMSTFERYVKSVRFGLSGKMSPVLLRSKEGRLSDNSCPKWANSGTVWHGEYWTRNSSVWPSGAGVCSLWEVLETNPPAKYCLTLRACEGILNRAERNGRSLPPILKEALTEYMTTLSNSAILDHPTSGGSGPLVKTDMSATLATSPDQTLFQSCLTPWDGQAVRVFNPYSDECPPALQAAAADSGTPSKTIIQRTFGKTHRASFPDDFTSYEPADVANTLNVFDVGEARANEIVCMTDTQPKTTIASGGGALGALTRRMYKDPPVTCLQTVDDYTSALRARADGSPCVDNGQPVICVSGDSGKQSIDKDLCGTLRVGGVMRSLLRNHRAAPSA